MNMRFLLSALLCFQLSQAIGQALGSSSLQLAQESNHKSVNTVAHVLKELEAMYAVKFLYKEAIANRQIQTPQNWNALSLQEGIQQLQQYNTNIQFKKIKKNFYTVDFRSRQNNPSTKHLETVALQTQQEEKNTQPVIRQDRTISGKVMDEKGLSLPGVSIVVKGSTNGTITDLNGEFRLSIPEGEVTLVFSSVGYVSQELSASQESFKVVMKEDVQTLKEVIVVAYNEQSKSSFTGSAVALDVSKIKESPRASFQESLQGNVAGVQSLSASGQPGAEPNIRIRGVGSINASSDPLYVIDGIPVVAGNISKIATSSNTIAGLNPNDIESITVLKDASATAIYGSRAANGVILITTKRGKTGKTKFDASAQYGISDIMLADRNQPLNTKELSELIAEGQVNAGMTRQEAETFVKNNIDSSVNTDWVDVISRTGKYQQYNISASGGNEKTNFYSSLGYYDQEAVIIGIDYKKVNGKVNVRHAATDKLMLELGLAANNQTLHTNDDGGNANNPVRAMYRAVPYEPVYNPDGSYNTGFLLTYNPVGLVNENIRETQLYGALGNLGLKYDILDNLSFETKGSLDFNLADEFRYDNPYFGFGRGNKGGIGRAYNNKVINWNITNLLKYRFQLNNDHSFNFILGQEAQKITRKSTYAQAQKFPAGQTTLENASEIIDASTAEIGSSLTSYLFSASYDFKGKYMINISGRRDGSSRFGREVRFANFGSVGFAWNVIQEPFMQNQKLVQELKIRSSYGINGNQEIGDYSTQGLYEPTHNYNNFPGYIYSQIENANLTWEKNKPFNVGVDFRIFNRISGTVEYYNRVTSDLLFNVPIPATNGLTRTLTNIGEMQNSGWEIALSSENIKSAGQDGFQWNTDFNISFNKNEIKALADTLPIIDGQYIREVGGDFYSFYLPTYAGVDPQTGDALWYKVEDGEQVPTNNYREATYQKQESALPKFYGGLTNSLAYKNFSLSFMFYFNWGNKIYDHMSRYTNHDGKLGISDRGNLSRKTYERRWQKPGDITDVPKFVFGNSQSGDAEQHSTRFLYDGSYIRLRDVTLAYQLPQNWVEKIHLSNARIYVRGSNLWTYVKDKDLEGDPEVGVTGRTDFRIPMSRQILFGVDFSF
ncbi:TonB-dependent receptor [Rapidithrix thailandica]|uniref:TonB-dependent receptor n=1 Tax=Rapidithrix thailandica TaxID=413964 RepID=A0AAW9S0K2_9BACT